MQRVILGHALDALLRDDVVAVTLRQVRAEHHLHAAPLRARTQLPLARHLHGEFGRVTESTLPSS